MKLLLVDDEPVLAKLMGDVLRRLGWEVAVAYSLNEAKAQNGPFDLVIADVRLPNGDGRDLRALHHGTPFIVISGSPGTVPDLPKPFSPQQLRDKVAEVTGRST